MKMRNKYLILGIKDDLIILNGYKKIYLNWKAGDVTLDLYVDAKEETMWAEGNSNIYEVKDCYSSGSIRVYESRSNEMWSINKVIFTAEACTPIELYEGGEVKSFILGEAVRVRILDQNVKLKSGVKIFLDEDGDIMAISTLDGTQSVYDYISGLSIFESFRGFLSELMG